MASRLPASPVKHCERTWLPYDGRPRLSNTCREWCEQAIHLAQGKLCGGITLFYRPFRVEYFEPGFEDGEVEHIEVEMAGDGPCVFNMTFVGIGTTARYQPFQESGHGYAAVCLLPDLAEAVLVIGLLQNHLDAEMRAQDDIPVRTQRGWDS